MYCLALDKILVGSIGVIGNNFYKIVEIFHFLEVDNHPLFSISYI